MKFEIKNVHTAVNADECELYSVGYFSSDVESLRRAVEDFSINLHTVYDRLDGIMSDKFERRFSCSCGSFSLFYPVSTVMEEK